TGGDYYDFFSLLDGGLCIAIGDASGHGISAALIMEETRASLRALALTGADAGAIVALTNRCLVNDLPTGQFVTMFLARLDPGTRSLVYCSAGHPSGYVLDQHGKVRLVLQSTNIPLGLDLTAEFLTTPAITLLTGDLLLLYTDGVTESFSPEDSLFGIERMLDVVRAHRHKSPAEIVQALFGAVADYSGNHAQLDDITAVIIKVEASTLLGLAPPQSAVKNHEPDRDLFCRAARSRVRTVPKLERQSRLSRWNKYVTEAFPH
ncbi:MAG TPA: PP2C family protein-serine/threonine phosphatase, partial [Pirellulaceae bacterium]|nr:PP2C family protein-serine/threonine phosphatase [Pirellulaceae bacterium]